MWLWVFTKTRKLRPLLKCKLNHFLRNEKCWIKSQLGHLLRKQKQEFAKEWKGIFWQHNGSRLQQCRLVFKANTRASHRRRLDSLSLFTTMVTTFFASEKGFSVDTWVDTQKISLFVMFCFHSAANNFSTFFTSIVIWSGLLAGLLAGFLARATYLSETRRGHDSTKKLNPDEGW